MIEDLPNWRTLAMNKARTSFQKAGIPEGCIQCPCGAELGATMIASAMGSHFTTSCDCHGMGYIKDQNLELESMNKPIYTGPPECPHCGTPQSILSEKSIKSTPEQLAEEYALRFTARDQSVASYLAGHCEATESAKETIERLTRERDEARGKVDRWLSIDGQRIAAERDTLKSELEKAREERDEAKSTLKFACAGWAEDDTEIKAIAEKFGIVTDDGSGYFICREQVMEEMGRKLTEARKEIARLKGQISQLEADLMAPADWRQKVGNTVKEWDSLRAELSAANARAEKAEAWNYQCVLVVDKVIGQLGNVNGSLEDSASRVISERDTLRQQLAEAEHRSVDVQAEWAIARKQRDSAPAALEAMREAASEIIKSAIFLIQRSGQTPGTFELNRDIGVLRAAISLAPSTALREHDLKIAEAAAVTLYSIGYMHGNQGKAQGSHEAWLASDIRAELMAEKEGEDAS